VQTDTASVLHEATGYIRFLHDQVQVLCSPYLQPSQVQFQNQPVSPISNHKSHILRCSMFMLFMVNGWSNQYYYFRENSCKIIILFVTKYKQIDI